MGDWSGTPTKEESTKGRLEGKVPRIERVAAKALTAMVGRPHLPVALLPPINHSKCPAERRIGLVTNMHVFRYVVNFARILLSLSLTVSTFKINFQFPTCESDPVTF